MTDTRNPYDGSNGDLTISAAPNPVSGAQGPVLCIKTDGTFWIDDREVTTDEQMRDSILYFSAWLRLAHRRRIEELNS